jgi:hypothetical protein
MASRTEHEKEWKEARSKDGREAAGREGESSPAGPANGSSRLALDPAVPRPVTPRGVVARPRRGCREERGAGAWNTGGRLSRLSAGRRPARRPNAADARADPSLPGKLLAGDTDRALATTSGESSCLPCLSSAGSREGAADEECPGWWCLERHLGQGRRGTGVGNCGCSRRSWPSDSSRRRASGHPALVKKLAIDCIRPRNALCSWRRQAAARLTRKWVLGGMFGRKTSKRAARAVDAAERIDGAGAVPHAGRNCIRVNPCAS